MSRDVNSENASKPSEKGEPKKDGDTFLERAKNYMPAWERPTLKATLEASAKVATGLLAAQVAFSGISRVEGGSTPEASDTALAQRVGKELTDRISSSLVAPEQANFRDKSLTAPSVSASQQEWVYKGPSVEEIWPNVHKEYVGKIEEASKSLHQGEAQGKDGRETALDFHSRKVTPGEKTSRSVTEAHPDQLKQDKSERAESSEKKETTWQDFEKMLNTEEMREGIKKLMQNKTAMKLIDKVTNNDKFMAGINDLVQNDEAKKALKAMMESEGFKELAVSQLKDEAGVRRALKAVANGTLTNECYKAYKNFFSYQECCRDQQGIPHCDENFKIDQKHMWELAGPFAGAGALAMGCGLYCCIKAMCAADKGNMDKAECCVNCAAFCCEEGLYCCCYSCIACCEALASGNID
jgi:hypothetical protein